ncbi:MAG: TonB-dependent receptor [Bacteroidales bacterium]
MRFLGILVLVIMIATTAYAQQPPAVVKGKVQSSDGHVPYVNVIVKGTSKGDLTDADGAFMIENVEPGMHTLVVKGLGYKSRELTLDVHPSQVHNVQVQLEADLMNMEAVVISANRHEVSRKDIPVIVNSLDNELFDATQSVSLAEGLNYSPGLRLENNCQNCGFTQVRMNGLDGPYSQVLVNSRPVFSALAGVYGLEQIPAEMIDRVEVVRGGGSALYGGSAIAGTINIITKEPCDNSWQLGMNHNLIDGTTPDRVLNANAAVISEDRKSGVFFYGLWRDREPYNANPDELWDRDGDGVAETKDDFSEIGLLESHSLGLDAFYRPSSNSKIKLDLYNLNEFRRGGNKFDQVPHQTDITEQARTNMLGGGVAYEMFTVDQKHKLSIYSSMHQVDRATYYGAEKDPDAYGNTDELTAVNGVQYGGDYDSFLFAPGMLTAGIEWKYQDLFDEKMGTQNVTVADQQIHNVGLYLQNDWEMQWFTLQAGIRYDDHTNIADGVLSPRFNVLRDLNDHWQLRMGYSTGFRAPQIFSEDLHIEVAGARRVITRMAEDLKPESSQSYTASIDYTGKIHGADFYFLAEGFYTALDNAFISEIQRDQAAGTVVMFRTNGSGARVRGVNLELKTVPSRHLVINSGFTLQSSRYNSKEVLWEPQTASSDSVVATQKMLRTPSAYGYLNVTWEPNHHWSVSSSGIFTGSMIAPHMTDPHTEYTELEQTPDFFDLNLKVAYHWHLNDEFKLQVFAGMKNILNSYQSDFDAGINRDAGYVYGPALPRTFTFGAKAGIWRP